MRISDWSSDVCSSDLLEGFLGDGAHRLHVAVELQVQHRANVERANRSVGVPGAVGAVLAEDLGEAAGVLGEGRKLHRAVLDEGHRFAPRLPRHHDVTALLANLPELLLEVGLDGLHPTALEIARETGREREYP